jgi:hypothetical protein
MPRALLSAVLLAVISIGPTAAATPSQDWCSEARNWNGRDETHCEVRTLTESAQSRLEGTTSNGSLTVTGTSRRDVSVQARIITSGSTMDAARDLARQVTVTLEQGRLRADGPRNSGLSRNSSWHVSYRAEVPATYNLDLDAANGAIAITGVRGTINAETANGSIRLTDLGGTVSASTQNGSAHATVSGSRWDGEGLSITTANGSARLDLPEKFNARLVLGTRNGGLHVDFPVTVQGRISGRQGRDIDTTLGSGGPTLEVRTANGSVRVGKR